MKKQIALVVMAALVITLTACGERASSGSGGQMDGQLPPPEQAQQRGEPDLIEKVDLPFDITGDFFDMYQTNTTAPAQMHVESKDGGYVVTCGESVSQPIAVEVDQVTGDVRLSGPMEKVNGQLPAQGSNWQLNASFNNWNGSPEASIYIMDVATNDQNSRIDGQFQKLSVRKGMYSYWKAEWHSDLGDYDWDNAALVQGVEVDYENGRFRFTFAAGYTSDWREPSSVSPSRCEFTDFPVTGPTGENLEASVYLEYNSNYSTADVTVYNADRTDRLLSFIAYTELDENFSMEQYLGVYETEPGEEAHTVTVEADRLTVDDRYVVEYTMEDFATKWRPLYFSDKQDSAYHARANFSFSENGEGRMELSAGSDDGVIRVYAIRK